jgi:septal ring factor EnvC (AmiA/AmiB activator)
MNSRRALRAAAIAAAILVATGRPQGAAPTGLRAGPAAPPPTPRDRADALAARAGARMQALRQEADALASREQSLLTDLRRLEVERQLRTEEARQAEADVRDASARLKATTDRIAALQEAQARMRPALDARLVALYKLGRGGYARLLLSTPALRDFGRAYRMVSALADRDRRQMADAQRTIDELRASRVALDGTRAELQKRQAGAERARRQATRAAADRSALVDRIDRERDLNARLAGELQVAQQRLQTTLAAMAGGDTSVPLPVLPIAPFRGALDWPVNGRVAAAFHAPAAGASAGFARDGIEIAAPEGTPVQAVHGGTVAFAGPFTGFGQLVILDHGDRDYSLYGNLASLADGLVKGARVDPAQPLGTVGVAAAGPPGLYFELQIDGQAVDPLQWLKVRR